MPCRPVAPAPTATVKFSTVPFHEIEPKRDALRPSRKSIAIFDVTTGMPLYSLLEEVLVVDQRVQDGV